MLYGKQVLFEIKLTRIIRKQGEIFQINEKKMLLDVFLLK